MNSSTNRLASSTGRASRYPPVPTQMATTCLSTGTGRYCGCLRISTTRAPRASCFCDSLSSSEPNCANASSARYCAIAMRRVPAIFFIALICAFPPTRETEVPTLIAGRTPAKNRSGSR